MALSTKHRVALFETLAPIAGEEPMNALLAEFPAAEGDELVTREFLRAELAELRTEFKSDIAELRAEMCDRFRRQTVWISSSFTVGMGLAVTIASLIP